MDSNEVAGRQELRCLTASKKWPSARNVPEEFVRQLVAAGALPGEEGELELAGAVRRVRLLRSWTAAGLSVETILRLVNRGALSLAFLDAPVMALRPCRTITVWRARDRPIRLAFGQHCTLYLPTSSCGGWVIIRRHRGRPR